jgi:hypothetical protein
MLAVYSKSIGEARLMIGNAIRIMCRSPKSRAGSHLAAAIGLRSMLEGFAPEIPYYALDLPTMKGKRMGRGLDHFRMEGAKLVPPPTAADPYEDEAYRLWAIKQRGRPMSIRSGQRADVERNSRLANFPLMSAEFSKGSRSDLFSCKAGNGLF